MSLPWHVIVSCRRRTAAQCRTSPFRGEGGKVWNRRLGVDLCESFEWLLRVARADTLVARTDYRGVMGTSELSGGPRVQTPALGVHEHDRRDADPIVSGSDKTWLPWAQLVSPFFGFTVSRGAPADEAIGELYAARTQQATGSKRRCPPSVTRFFSECSRSCGVGPLRVRRSRAGFAGFSPII